MVASHHNGSHFAVADHLIEAQGNIGAAPGVLIEDAGLSADHQFVLFGIADPDPVVFILEAAVGIDDLHGGSIGFIQIFRLAAETNPTERTIAVVKKHGSKDIFHIGGPDKAVQCVFAILGAVSY